MAKRRHVTGLADLERIVAEERCRLAALDEIAALTAAREAHAALVVEQLGCDATPEHLRDDVDRWLEARIRVTSLRVAQPRSYARTADVAEPMVNGQPLLRLDVERLIEAITQRLIHEGRNTIETARVAEAARELLSHGKGAAERMLEKKSKDVPSRAVKRVDSAMTAPALSLAQVAKAITSTSADVAACARKAYRLPSRASK